MQERPVSELPKTPEKGLHQRIPPSALWVASGVLSEHAGKKTIEDVDGTVTSLSARKTEDLSSHHQKIAAFSTKQREMHWLEKSNEDPKFKNTDERIMTWQDGVMDYVGELQKQSTQDSFYSVLETLGVNDDIMDHPEDFSDALRHKIEDFRKQFLVGPAKIEEFAAYFTKGRSLEENIEALSQVEGFLGVFGGQETVALVKDAIIAHAYIDSLGQDERQKELLDTARTVLGTDLSDETAGLYGMLYQGEVGMQPGIEMGLTPPLTENEDGVEPAPIEEKIAGQEEAEDQAISSEETGGHMSYDIYQQRAMERELAAFPNLQEWLFARKETFKEMAATLGNAPVTGEGWGASFTNNEDGVVNGVEKIGNENNAFTVEGIDGLPWHQVGIRESTVPVTLDTPDGKTTADLSGFVGVVKDGEGNVLVAAYQGPFMHTENRLVVRTPLQTSAGKFKAMQEGDTAKDKNFVDVLKILYGQEDPFGNFLKAIATGEAPVWPFPAINENRIDATNIGVVLTSPDDLRQQLTKDGQYRWVSKDEIAALSRAGLLNTVAASAFSAA